MQKFLRAPCMRRAILFIHLIIISKLFPLKFNKRRGPGRHTKVSKKLDIDSS